MSILEDAALAAALFAVDPIGTGGVCLRSQVHPARDHWLHALRALLPQGTPLKRIPCNIGDGRLLGGLDLAATLAANRPIAEPGVLAACHGGIVVVSMAERLSAHTAAALGAVLDAGEVGVLRDAISSYFPARLGVVAFDEGIGDDEFLPGSLLDRLAFILDFEHLSPHATLVPLYDADEVLAARSLLPRVLLDHTLVERLCGTAAALGVDSLRSAWLATRVARAAAALEGRLRISEDDAILAGRLVLAPRATVAPPQTRESSATPPTRDPPKPDILPPPVAAADTAPERPQPATDDTEDSVLAASQSAIPAGLLARLKSDAATGRVRASSVGRAGGQQKSTGRGRPTGVRSGAPSGNARLNVLETLRSAAPWQRLRGRRAQDARLRILPSDFRVTSSTQRSRTLTIFAVDASGSSALNRLAEAKGAVELLLAECYRRRDQVAVIAFRGRAAELLLPPTRSLVRAKRSLAGMPGGGATPLAAAIAVAVELAAQTQRRGETPTFVLLSDGRANMARDGTIGREPAHRDALAAAAALRATRITTLFIDTAPRPNALAAALALAMNAQYIPLPFANSRTLSHVVQSVTAASGR